MCFKTYCFKTKCFKTKCFKTYCFKPKCKWCGQTEYLYKITHYCKYQGYHICISCYNDKLKNKL